jgi:oxaloacetate decarboxylase beta subunit
MNEILNILQNPGHVHWQQWVMIGIGLALIYLAIKKEYEPLLLLPMGVGCMLTNFPGSAAIGAGLFGMISDIFGIAAPGIAGGHHGFLSFLFDIGIRNELFPILIFISIGAMIDFSPLLKQPVMIFFGGPGHVGVFVALLLALGVNYVSPGFFSVQEAASVGIIGAADGPTSIYMANQFALKYLAPITVAAYSYMSLVPIIQPPMIKMLTSREERRIRMKADYKAMVSPKVVILFPIVIIVITGLLIPAGLALVGPLMFGNLIRVCGVVDRLANAAQNELANVVTLLLGIAVGSTMVAKDFITWQTLCIMALGLLAFAFDTVGGVLFAKLINLFLPKHHKLNPMIGAAGLSAFPMAARVVQKMAQEEDHTNIILMPAIGANVAGQIGSIVIGCILITLLSS